MTDRSITIDGSEYADAIRSDSFSFVEAANNGEVGVGGFQLYDSTAAIDVPAMKEVLATEPAASPTRMYSGFTQERTSNRGPNKVAGQRQWDVELVDLNTLLDDYVLKGTESADRPAETDYERITWLLTTRLNTIGAVSAGVVPNTNTVDLDAVDYRGKYARDVLSECIEAAGKLGFLYDYGSGRKLYYDLASGTSLTSSAQISDVYTDVDSSTTWAPASPATVKRNPDRIYSGIRFKWKSGAVFVEDGAIATAYRTREKSVEDTSVKSATKATNKANKLLAGSGAELLEVSQIQVRLPRANVNDIRAGQRMQIKLDRHGVSSFTYYRIIRRQVVPLPGASGASDVEYLVTLTLLNNVLVSANGGRGADATPEERTNATDDDASVVIDRNGVTITDGALTLTDAFGSTVMEAAGFAGSWADFIRLGLYNARFTVANTGGIAAGRTSDLPYWTVSFTATGVLTGLTGGGIKATFGALSDGARIQSDMVPVRPGSVMEVGMAYLVNRAAGTLTLNGFVYWFKADGSASATASTSFANSSFAASVSTLRWFLDALIVPSDAVSAYVVLSIAETVSHNAANYVSIYAAKLIDQPVPVPPGLMLADSGIHSVVTPSGTLDDYDPGTIDVTTFLRIDPTANVTLDGLIAPTAKWRLVYLFNQGGASSYTVTIKNDNAGSASANRFYTPGNTDLVLQPMEGRLILYSTTLSHWLILA